LRCLHKDIFIRFNHNLLIIIKNLIYLLIINLMFKKVSIHYILLGSVILIAIALLIIFCVIRKSKEKRESYTSSGFIPGCKVAPAMQFPEIPNNKECPSSVIDTGNIKAAYILFIRHCDRGYPTIPSKKPYIPQPLGKDGKPGTKIRTTCSEPTKGCLGCEYMDTLEGCATNNCSEKGVKRSWALGKWINCFAKDKGLPISTVVGEKFVGNVSNQRPHTTAAIIYESLMNLNHSPCWFTAEKDNSDHAIKKYVQSDNVKDKIVVVVWNHGGLPGLIKDVTSFYTPWDDCCFDKVFVMDNINKKFTSYDAKSLEESDLCGSPCKNDDKSISPYVTSQGQTCSYAIFGDSTPCTVPDSTICTSEQSCTDTSVCTCLSGSRCGDYGKCCSQDCTNIFCDQRNECGETCGCGEGQYCDGYRRCLPCKTDKDCDFMNQNCNTATGECVDKSFSPAGVY
jgi:hypothetical protein